MNLDTGGLGDDLTGVYGGVVVLPVAARAPQWASSVCSWRPWPGGARTEPGRDRGQAEGRPRPRWPEAR